MKFEWTLTAGALGIMLQLLLILVVIIGAYWKLYYAQKNMHEQNKANLEQIKETVELLPEVKNDVVTLKTQVKPIWEWFIKSNGG